MSHRRQVWLLAAVRPSIDATLTPCHCGSGAEKDDVALRLYRAALAGDLVAMASALAEGAEVNGSIVGKEAGRTALIGAAVGVKTSPSSQRSTDGFIRSCRFTFLETPVCQIRSNIELN